MEKKRPKIIDEKYRDKEYHCPDCGKWIGGYTNKESENWGYERYKFCPECGCQIDWSGIH